MIFFFLYQYTKFYRKMIGFKVGCFLLLSFYLTFPSVCQITFSKCKKEFSVYLSLRVQINILIYIYTLFDSD